jgi:predicted ABC-type ATPase
VPKPTIYLIAGCNGAGKTTFAIEYLSKEVNCLRFLNPDEIARGLSPLAPAAAAFKAARLLLREVRHSIRGRESFGLESTLSGKTYLQLLRQAKRAGFRIHLHYLWLPTPILAIRRIRERVRKGGHNVRAADVRRRFGRSLRHFVENYAPLADRWALWDNQTSPARLLADSETCSLPQLRDILLLK